MSTEKYHVILTNDEAQTGFVLDYNGTTSSPAQRNAQVPSIQSGVPGGKTFSARDTDPPYPLESNDWRGGAGQKLLDVDNPVFNAYWQSRHIDPSVEGVLSIGPSHLTMLYDTTGTVGKIADKMVLADHVWASFTKETDGDQIRRLTVVETSNDSSTYRLSTTTDTTLSLANTTLPVGTYLYSTTTNEIVYISVAGADYTVTRGACYTVPTPHVYGEVWRAYYWEKATWLTGGTAPDANPVSAMCTDGEHVFAATHTPGSANGSIWRGTTAGSETGDWDLYANIPGVVDMTYCEGVLYVAQQSYAPNLLKAGVVIGAPLAFSPISGISVLYPNVTSVGLAASGHAVYWAVAGADRGWAYKLQYVNGTADVFELAAELPPGFIPTSEVGHLSNVYVGGYTDTGVLNPDGITTTHHEGTIYLISGADVAKVCSLTDTDVDNTVLGLGAYNRFLYILTRDSFYRYDTFTGGYHQYISAPYNAGSLSGGGITWNGTYYPYVGGVEKGPVDEGWTKAQSANTTPVYTWPDGYNFHVKVPEGDVYNHEYVAWYQDDAALTGGCTIEVGVDDLYSQAGQFGINDSQRCAVVRLVGVVAGDGTVSTYNVKLAKWNVATGAYEYLTFSFSPGGMVLRLTLDSTGGARLYVNENFMGSVAYGDLRPVGTGVSTSPSRAYFSCGWQAPNETTDKLDEKISYSVVRWSYGGAYPPGWTGGTVLTEPGEFVVDNGTVYAPMPNSHLLIGDPTHLHDCSFGYAYLQTSESTLGMGTREKYFSSADVLHTPLQSGQTLTVTPYVDGIPSASVSATGDLSTLTRAPINAQGGKISVRVTLEDAQLNRTFSQTLRVFNITAYFSPLPSGSTYQFVFNVSNRARLRTGKPYDVASDVAIRRLFNMVGSTVQVSGIYGDFSAYVEQVAEISDPSDMKTGDRERGHVQVTMKSLDT